MLRLNSQVSHCVAAGSPPLRCTDFANRVQTPCSTPVWTLRVDVDIALRTLLVLCMVEGGVAVTVGVACGSPQKRPSSPPPCSPQQSVAIAQSSPPHGSPPQSVAIAQLIGAVLFSCGSACFVWMAWVDDWVLPLRLGCGAWIGGCLPYLWPPLKQELLGSLTTVAHASNALQVGGMLSWAIGSAFAFRDDLDSALLVTNGAFLAGSVCLLCDSLLQAWPFCSTTPSTRCKQISLLLANLDVHAGLFYVLAGGFGGYASETSLLRFGNCCWLVGSLISGVNPCLALYAGAQGGERSSCAPPAGDTPKTVELEAKAASTASAV